MLGFTTCPTVTVAEKMIKINVAEGEVPPVLSVKASQRYLGQISRASIYRILDDDLVESTRIRGRRMILRSSLDALIERSRGRIRSRSSDSAVAR
jgi:hypothetical protein